MARKPTSATDNRREPLQGSAPASDPACTAWTVVPRKTAKLVRCTRARASAAACASATTHFHRHQQVERDDAPRDRAGLPLRRHRDQRSVRPKPTYRSSSNATRCTTTNTTDAPPRKRCTSSTHAGFGRRTSRLARARPQSTDAVTSAQATMPLAPCGVPPDVRTHLSFPGARARRRSRGRGRGWGRGGGRCWCGRGRIGGRDRAAHPGIASAHRLVPLVGLEGDYGVAPRVGSLGRGRVRRRGRCRTGGRGRAGDR